jgi:hypothetical protein
MNVGRISCWIVTSLGALFCLPLVLSAALTLRIWMLSLIPGYYSTAYPYWLVGVILLGICGCAVAATIHIARLRAYVFVIVPVFLCLLTAVKLPSFLPPRTGPDIEQLQSARRACDTWWSSHNQYPSEVNEVTEALSRAHAESPYRLRGIAIPYDLVISANATGPRLNDVQSRPGVLYYAVSSDRKQYWLTMTVLPGPVSAKASLLKIPGRRDRAWVIHGEVGHSPDFSEQTTGAPLQ